VKKVIRIYIWFPQWTQGNYERTEYNDIYAYYQVQLPISFPNTRIMRMGGFAGFINTTLAKTAISMEYTPSHGASVCVSRSVYDSANIGIISGIWFGK
jgi:hypothetical protein